MVGSAEVGEELGEESVPLEAPSAKLGVEPSYSGKVSSITSPIEGTLHKFLEAKGLTCVTPQCSKSSECFVGISSPAGIRHSLQSDSEAWVAVVAPGRLEAGPEVLPKAIGGLFWLLMVLKYE